MNFTEGLVSAEPKAVRQLLHTHYERYAQGETLFPRMRMLSPPEAFPRKTQAIATALHRAWEVIDEDDQVFNTSLATILDGFSEDTDQERGKGLVVTRVGINAVRYAIVTPGDRISVLHNTVPVSEARELYGGIDLNLMDGRSIALSGGRFEGSEPDMLNIRRSNIQLVYAHTPTPQV